MKNENKVLLLILDGFGEAPAGPGNAVTLAKTPHLAELRSKYPHSLVQTSGEAVGLVEGSMGGSEVGHFTMGAGRIVPQFLLAINWAIKDGSFYTNPALKSAFDEVKKTGKKLHLVGMISDKGVHSDISHLLALIDWAAKEKLEQVFIHCITDGRDVEERSATRYLKMVQEKIAESKVGKIATIVGRYFAMDRDRNFDRTEMAYRLMTQGEGEAFADPLKAIESAYAKDAALTDYYLPPIVVDKDGVVETGDAVIFFNYRTDRTKQLTAAFTEPDFTHFKPTIGKVHFVCMGPYSEIAPVAFQMPTVQNNLSQWLSAHNIRQLRIAETEKYAHVTFFFNSQIEHPLPLEDRILVNSPKVASYAEKPEMSAPEVTEKILAALKKGDHQAIIVNYANGDLVGHSGSLAATIKAVETLDDCIAKLVPQAMESGYTMLITADHGNADDMLYPNGDPKPAHSMNPVPFLVIDPEHKIQKVRDGGLADVAPTILKILGLPKPKEMTGESLV
ncbi:2,3-bisphosphoglycerate-independent phosphoglycerate mutase [Candidatus Peregrinibacteria bacterium]|nr:2,3-bisphosphoglycerate-independent phosphoglycerate mutase [Candidatus Peregrinibacteria bacterium]